MLVLANLMLHILHISTIIFNLIGWIFPKTRKAHFVFLLLTLFSWFGLGLFYGWGYCPLTDWQWQIQRNLGNFDLPHSYIKYLIDNVFSANFPPFWTDVITVLFFAFALICSLKVNFFNKSKVK